MAGHAAAGPAAGARFSTVLRSRNTGSAGAKASAWWRVDTGPGTNPQRAA